MLHFEKTKNRSHDPSPSGTIVWASSVLLNYLVLTTIRSLGIQQLRLSYEDIILVSLTSPARMPIWDLVRSK
jgi:hypothetical protein